MVKRALNRSEKHTPLLLAPQLLLRQVAEQVAPPAAHGRAPRARTRREHRQHPRREVVRQVAQQGG